MRNGTMASQVYCGATGNTDNQWGMVGSHRDERIQSRGPHPRCGVYRPALSCTGFEEITEHHADLLGDHADEIKGTKKLADAEGVEPP